MLTCKTCGVKVAGVKDARKHWKATGHKAFKETRKDG